MTAYTLGNAAKVTPPAVLIYLQNRMVDLIFKHQGLCLSIQRALRKVNLLSTTITEMGPIEFVRKNLFFSAAIRAFAVK